MTMMRELAGIGILIAAALPCLVRSTPHPDGRLLTVAATLAGVLLIVLATIAKTQPPATNASTQ
jgi:hypothetical protein